MLEHHDRVRPRRHRRARHDLDGLPRSHHPVETLARAHLSGDVKLPGEIRGAHREAVADGTRERRLVAVGVNVLGQHAPSGGVNLDLLHRRRRAPRPNLLFHTLARFGE